MPDRRPRVGTPSMTKIVGFWRGQRISGLRSDYIGWGEPFCFGCGWLPPVQDGIKTSWLRAERWLDRAHLVDHCYGGDMEPHNLVPLCHLCHHKMPDFDTKAPALQWVLDRPKCDWKFQLWTDCFCRGKQVSRSTTLTRAKLACLEFAKDLGCTENTGKHNGLYVRGVVMLWRHLRECDLLDEQEEEPTEEEPTEEELRTRADTLRAKQLSLEDDYTAKLITRAQMERGTATIKKRLAEIDAALGL